MLARSLEWTLICAKTFQWRCSPSVGQVQAGHCENEWLPARSRSVIRGRCPASRRIEVPSFERTPGAVLLRPVCELIAQENVVPDRGCRRPGRAAGGAQWGKHSSGNKDPDGSDQP